MSDERSWIGVQEQIKDLVGADYRSRPSDEAARLLAIAAQVETDIHTFLGKGYVAALSEEAEYLASACPNPQVILDVGTNRGEWTEAALTRFPSARIYGFEPQSVHIESLRDLVRQSAGRFSFVQAALSNKRETLNLFRDSPGSTLASLYKRDILQHGVKFDDLEVVQAFTLEDWALCAGVDSIDIIKIDVEGHEMGVLQGAGKLLDTVRVLQFEFGGTMIDSRFFVRDFYQFLNDRGFNLYRMAKPGLFHINGYWETHESYDYANFVAIRR